MQLHCQRSNFSAPGSLAAPVRCPHCDDWMVAPFMSEFVESGEIRHHYECDTCGENSCTSIPLELA